MTIVARLCLIMNRNPENPLFFFVTSVNLRLTWTLVNPGSTIFGSLSVKSARVKQNDELCSSSKLLIGIAYIRDTMTSCET
jgi:hypothetical protein